MFYQHSMSCEYPEGCSCGASEFNALRAENARLKKDSARLKWLHTGGGKDSEGYEWGVARIKHDANGRLVDALWTFSDHSDLDAEMAREASICSQS